MKYRKTLIILSVLTAAALAAVSFFGAFVPGTYDRETASMAAQGAGQDLVDLFLVVPLLIFSMIFMLRGSRIAVFLFGGTVFYTLYSFAIYSFGVHFNRLFLLYCLILGAALYLFILIMFEMGRMDVNGWVGEKIPVRSAGIFLILVAALFYVLWLKDTVPAVIKNTVPKSVSDYHLLVNPVHVLDMAIVLPGLILTAVLLMKKRRLGYILGPVMLVFVIILAVALAGMVVMTKVKGVSEGVSIAVIFALLAAVSTLFLCLFLKNINPSASG